MSSLFEISYKNNIVVVTELSGPLSQYQTLSWKEYCYGNVEIIDGVLKLQGKKVNSEYVYYNNEVEFDRRKPNNYGFKTELIKKRYGFLWLKKKEVAFIKAGSYIHITEQIYLMSTNIFQLKRNI